jgi:hypothetical protein
MYRSLNQHMAKRGKMDLKRSNGVPTSALDRTWCDRAQLQLNARSRFECWSSQPASHIVAIVGPTIPSLPAIRRGSYLRLIIESMIERMHQCNRTHSLRSNAAL